ncbi:MAG: sensor histidine kinase [Flavobacteriales bacterium]|nr:sensor histidine kinase [Flavobacteriales bacterium]MCB9192674.1 sensor histidine kinase [Flavobacteriales bacterium]MCB9203550.1 sensor histidine kinase [Flavobacteriales bacterium]
MYKETGVYHIRPSAKLIHTIGGDLIGDPYAAVVELVKNSYDADASEVKVLFDYSEVETQPAIKISISDDGHGMNKDTVVDKWLVPATDDKLKRKCSPSGRLFQGRKGIGRFAASILGQELTLQTVDINGVLTEAVIDWRLFNADSFLSDIDILLESEQTTRSCGTHMTIVGQDEEYFEEYFDEQENQIKIFKTDEKYSYWLNRANIEKLENELRKLISPFGELDEDVFEVSLEFRNCPIEEFNDRTFKIESYPIIELYDYRISGIVEPDGKGHLLYENNVEDTGHSENISFKYRLEDGLKPCGRVKVDFRVFDREPEAIENLINKGLIDPITEKYAGKNEAKALLNKVYGVKIYRSKFRIRPYGDDGDDWLELDKRRIQNFTLRVSNNQVVGFVTIEPEENSNLLEKSARDGLKETPEFKGLKEICRQVLKELELKRLTYREKTLKSRKGRSTIQNSLNSLFSFSDLTENVEKQLSALEVSPVSIAEIKEIIRKEEARKAGLLEDIQKTIAIYQGQATLGKIVSFILHEGRKSVQYFRDEGPVVKRYLKHYRASKDETLLEDLEESVDGYELHGAMISDLFKRINPLAIQKKSSKSDFDVLSCISDAAKVFKGSALEKGIKIEVSCPPDISVFGWREDLYMCMTNLIENSLHWLEYNQTEEGKIQISVKNDESIVIIDFLDNGPGLTDEEIETDIIFEPGYSRKLSGTGLGLAIAGEAIDRLNGSLKALKNEGGAYFRIEIETNYGKA